MVIMAHWQRKRKVSWCVFVCVRMHVCACGWLCVCVCVFYVGHPTMSNGPSLCAASCAELLPAVTLTHTNKCKHAAGEIFFFGVSLSLIPSTMQRPEHLLLSLFSNLKVAQWSSSMAPHCSALLSLSYSFFFFRFRPLSSSSSFNSLVQVVLDFFPSPTAPLPFFLTFFLLFLYIFIYLFLIILWWDFKVQLRRHT